MLGKELAVCFGAVLKKWVNTTLILVLISQDKQLPHRRQVAPLAVKIVFGREDLWLNVNLICLTKYHEIVIILQKIIVLLYLLTTMP